MSSSLSPLVSKEKTRCDRLGRRYKGGRCSCSIESGVISARNLMGSISASADQCSHKRRGHLQGRDPGLAVSGTGQAAPLAVGSKRAGSVLVTFRRHSPGA
jgi:hypothetical protein